MSRRARRSWLMAVGLAVGATLIATPAATTVAASGAWVAHTYTPGPADNPLKGFLPFEGRYSKFPHSMEWNYVAWKDIQTDFDTFNWRPIDGLLRDIASRGHHAAFRIYADYPNKPYGVPDFLSMVARHAYTDQSNGVDATSYSPDYDDPNLVRAMTDTIRALGARYDGDPRIGFITVGFLGFWGEWHTYRDSCACNEWMPSAATQTLVLDTFDQAFDRTKLLVRYPDVGWSGQSMGFHDDSFANQTIDPPDWKFVGRLKTANAAGQWQTEPIGGELFVTDQPCTFSATPCNPSGQDFNASVDATHASWIINHYAFATGYEGADYTRALAGARRLGYDLFVSAVKVADTTTGELAVDVRMQNAGIAPFYYDWTIQLGVADGSKRLVATYDTAWRLTRVIGRGVDVEFSHLLQSHSLAAGRYTLLMRAVNPLAKGRPLAFANTQWNRDVAGWLTLDTFAIPHD